jgi:transcriptional regulator with XRE-family HTH domain
MDDLRFGSALRAVRQRRELRQRDVATKAGVSPSTVSRAERGHVGSLSVDTIRRISAVLEVRVELLARWRGGDLDRLLNVRHSLLSESVARAFAQSFPEWSLVPEVSFSIFGERGVIDLVAWNTGHRALLLIELKTDLADVNELVGTFDRKVRLGRTIAKERGWDPLTVSGWVIVAPGRTSRARIAAHGGMLRAAFPQDGRVIGAWLRRPTGRVSALSMWRNPGSGRGRGALAPVRRVRPRPSRDA